MIRIIYSWPGLLMAVGGVLIGLLAHGAVSSIALAVIIGAILPLLIDFIWRWRLRGDIETDHGALIDARYGGMLYYCPIWILSLIVIGVSTLIYFTDSSADKPALPSCSELTGSARRAHVERERRCLTTHSPSDCDPIGDCR
jgi:hypothetical protein